jgi:hypothetical protein
MAKLNMAKLKMVGLTTNKINMAKFKKWINILFQKTLCEN